MKPFLLLASRPEDDAADAEYEAFLHFTGLASESLHRIRMELAPLPAINLDEYSGIIVGGGPYNSSDPEEKKSATQRRVEREVSLLLDQIVERDFPFLGACYGVGTLGKHQGAIIDGTYGERPGDVPISLTPAGLVDPVLANVPQIFNAFVGHKEACTVLPANATLLASAPNCPVQMFKVKQNLYATQFHPELDVEGIIARLKVYRHEGYFAADELDSIVAQVGQADIVWPSLILRNFVNAYTVPVSSHAAHRRLAQ